MRLILKIINKSKRTSKEGTVYSVTTAQMDDGQIAEGFGTNFEVGDEVEVFHHAKYDKVKMRKGA